MNIKNIARNALEFTINRLIEILGVLITVVGLLLLIALISYSPEDPNFIFPDNLEIKNLLGIRGSYVSDIFYQSIGLISFLIPNCAKFNSSVFGFLPTAIRTLSV